MLKKIILITAIIMSMVINVSCSLSSDLEESGIEEGPIQYGDDIMDNGPVKGGTINLFCSAPDTLNPLLTTKATVQDITGLIFEGLVRLDNEQKPVPQLADSWNVSDDGLIWTFHIRENVYWQDKIQLTAEDVEYTVQTIINPAVNSVYKANVQNITTFAAIDRNTFRVFLKKPDSFTVEMMTFPILPKHYFEGEDILKTGKNQLPVGTGPYRFISRDSGSIKLAANEFWWNRDSEKKYKITLPYIQEINVKIVKSTSDALSMFQTRDIDMTPVENGDSSKYTGRTDLIIKKFPGRNFDFLAFNMSERALKEKPVRQAIAYAINKDRIINDCLSGDATASDLPLVPGTWLYDTNMDVYGFDINKARTILSQDGWKLGSNGVLYKILNGSWTQLDFNLIVNESNVIRNSVAAKISEQLGQLGVRVNIKKVKESEEVRLLNSKSYDMALVGVRTSSVPDISYMYSSAEIPAGKNIAGYKNDTVDACLEQIKATSEENTKKALYNSLRNIISEDLPYAGLYFYNSAIIYNKNVRGEMRPYSWNKLNDITQWYISKTKKSTD